ncbi:MAG: acyl-CoA thioesterase [Pseudomonadota bacterium]|nr:acyl-CoA thioesterase [Pseudomonadota bacterium]
MRWGDMDAQGHVNNTVYFRYMEQARVEWLGSLHERVGDGGAAARLSSVIVNASCTFLLPLCYPGTVEVRMFVDPPGRSSIDTHYELSMDDRKYAEGSSRIVWIDVETQRSSPLPDQVRAMVA